MERGKRSLSLLLACIMALAVLPGTAWAAGTGQAASTVPLSQQTLEEVSRNLGVPENLAVEIEQSDAYYWDAGGRWLIQVDVYYQGEMVAGAAVDAATGEHVRNIYMYTPPEDSETPPEIQENKKLVGTWGNDAAISEDGLWALAYETIFSPDGRVAQYGWRNRDCGTYEMTGENTAVATFRENWFDSPGYGYEKLEGLCYTVTYTYDADTDTLYASYSQDLADSNATSGTLHKMNANGTMPSWVPTEFPEVTSTFQLGRDNFSFINEPSAFLTNAEYTTWVDHGKVVPIKLSEEAFQKIVAQATTPAEVAACLQACSREWSGSCFGMSSVMSILYRERDRLPAALGDTASAVPAPVHSALAQDVINSYQVGWQLAAVQNLALQEQKKAEENYAGALQDLIDSVNDISTPTVIAMQGKNTVGETSGHAVLLLSVLEENEEYYVVRCCDPNEATKFTNMLVYKTPGYQQLGLRILYYGSSQPGEAETVYTDLYYWSTSIEDIDAYHYFTENSYRGDYAATIMTVANAKEVWASSETGKRYIVGGEAALDGVVFGPILDPAQRSITDNAGAQSARYYLDDSAATGYTVGFEQMEAGGSVQLLADNLGACLSTTGEGSMTVEEGTKTVAVSLDTQADTTVAITNQEASEDWDWFQAEISVPDAATLRLTLTKDGVAVQGDNLEQAEVTVYGWEGSQTVAAEVQNGQLMISKEGTATESGFADISPDDYYYNAVLWAVNNGITNGTGTNTFSPNAPCTRAQMAVFLWRATGSPAPAANTCPFTDLDRNAYYYEAILWAVEQGITVGTSSTAYSPNSPCTRGQMATFLYRYSGTPAVTGTAPFGDVARGAYYHNAVCWAVAQGITNGTSNTRFSPAAPCTRGQMVTFLHRLLGE